MELFFVHEFPPHDAFGIVQGNEQKLSYSIFLLQKSKKKADDRTRTDNLLITSQLLCQLSHIGVTRAEYKKYIIILSPFRQVFFTKFLCFQKKCVSARRISNR